MTHAQTPHTQALTDQQISDYQENGYLITEEMEPVDQGRGVFGRDHPDVVIGTDCGQVHHIDAAIIVVA